MPKFPKNTSSFMKYSEKGSTFPFKSPMKTAGASSLEISEQKKKKSTDSVVNPDTSRVTSVGTQRLVDAGAPPDVIQKSRNKFIAEQKIRQAEKSSATKKIEKIPTLPSKKLPTNTKMGHGNKPIDFERGGYGQKLDPKKAGFPGDYTPKKEAAPLRKKIGKRTVEKLPEGGKRVRVTDKEGRVKKEVIKGKGYRGVTKFDKQGREVVSKSRSGSMLNPERKSKTKTSYQDDFSNKKSEVKLTTKERGKKKKVIKAKYKKDNRDFFPG